MAPSRPLPRPNAAPSKSILKNKTKPPTDSGSLFPTTKKDKRRIKHAQLLSKVTKSTTSKPRRRRPNKKLVTTLDALADALPDDDELEDTATTRAAGVAAESQVNIIKRKSMKSRPGAMKRKQKLDNSEKERFRRNMAQMAVAPVSTPAGEGVESGGAPSRFQALRGFIAQTLERRADFVGVGG